MCTVISARWSNWPFQIGLQTKLSQTDEALKVVQDTLRTYREEGPSGNELGAAKKDITGGFPLRTASNADIIGYLAVIGFYDLPLDYLDTFTGKIDVLTQEQIVDAFQRRLDPDKMLTVIVGGEEKTDETTTDATGTEDSSDEAATPASE